VHLTNDAKLERARTALRNFVADHLKTRDEKDAALVAFVSPSESTWRFSYVKMEYATVEKDSGKIGVKESPTPARRFSYIVGAGESCHTAQTRFLDLLQETETDPTLAGIEEAFSVETVTKEFFTQYVKLFEAIRDELDKLAAKDKAIDNEFSARGVNTVDFAKKLMGQIVFLYFLQKKGWLGVAKGQDWGSGPRDFLRRLAKGEYGPYANFFNDVLEPLFYDELAADRGHAAWSQRFNCRIPFLNGGLFEPLGDYDWRKTDILLPDKLFTNTEFVEEGITGTGVLDVFDRYNFTVNEAEPLEKEVAIDPEMLGKVFENLIEDNRRKGLGAYYTPREIVHYMCQESLINYLDTALNQTSEVSNAIPRADIETFIHRGEQISHYEAVETEYRIRMPKSIEQHARQIDEALAEITVCDPAVGSGAFPVGMMNEIVRARSALTPYFNAIGERTPYHFKRHASQHCLYGVDIDPGAVEIAKLRLWLSLVVDEEDVKQIKPLPNLDYKIVAGNSLLGIPFKSQRVGEIERLKDTLFDETDHAKKAELKAQVDKLLAEVFAASKKSLGYEVNFDFQIFFSEVFREKGGFDVVIANPPYVSALEFSKQHSKAERTLLKKNYQTARGAYDIYVLFIERGLNFLAKGGVLAYINPNKYLSAKYAEALREYILSNGSLVKLLDVSGIIVFEQAAVYPVVTVILKSPSALDRVTIFLPRTRQAQIFDPVNFVKTSVSSKVLRSLPEYIWGFLLSPNIEILLKFTKEVSHLSDVASINASSTAREADEYGAYIQNQQSKNSLKLVNTGTIEKFSSRWGIIHLTNAGQKYLTPYLPLDKARVNSRRRDLYRSPKLIFAKMAKFCEAFYDVDGEYASINTNCLYDPKDGISLGFMAGYCNSTLFMFFYAQFFGSLRMSGGYYQFQSPQFRVLPFKKPDASIDARVSGFVKDILTAKERNPDADTTALEREIDQLVYQIYGLTAEEIAIVEEATRKK
ncbi:MAG: Eco57I restriction-modification methylase domain-containing protein, partial [Chloroflexi bacterium]|nr:Eco57I restriction-modification methylase domain-containing protein [Chloroflexota bacterium]